MKERVVLDEHRFQMLDRESGRQLSNAIEVHTLELTKYNLQEETLSQVSKLEQWAFLLLRAQDYDAESLNRLLPGVEFETAIDTLEIISAKTEDKQMSDQREKAQRDYEWALSGAREEGREASMSSLNRFRRLIHSGKIPTGAEVRIHWIILRFASTSRAVVITAAILALLAGARVRVAAPAEATEGAPEAVEVSGRIAVSLSQRAGCSFIQ